MSRSADFIDIDDESAFAAARQIAKLSLRQKPPPCEKFKCGYKNICASEYMACNSFIKYVSLNKSLKPTAPTREIYNRLFSGATENDA